MKYQNSFKDPIRNTWVHFGIFILFLAMVPVWRITGNWFGIPAWAVFAVLVSILTSLFTAFVIVRVWHDPDELGENND